MHKKTSWARLARWIAIAAAIGALVVPSAQARPLIDGGRTGSAEPEFVPGVTDFPSRLGERGELPAQLQITAEQGMPEQVAVRADESGFDWRAAGLGALLMACGLMAVAAGAGHVARRKRIVVA
jgi:hypothetical protein